LTSLPYARIVRGLCPPKVKEKEKRRKKERENETPYSSTEGRNISNTNNYSVDLE